MNRSKPNLEARMRAYLESCARMIDQHGHMVQSVFGDDLKPPFAYTVGISRGGGAELIVIGLPSETSQHLLNGVAARLAEADIPDHQDIVGVVNMPVRLRTIDADEAWAHMATARALDTRPATVRQVLWPDPKGRFPGDPAYRYAVAQALRELELDESNH